MTFREKLKEDTGRGINGFGCPSDHGYEERPSFYTHCAFTTCEACWNREIEEKEQKPMKYKVGDTVLVQATIVDIDDEEPIEEWPIRVRFCDGEELRYNEEDLFELPKPEKTYEQGLEDAWELARKVFDMDYNETVEVFDCDTCDIMKMTPQEALAKLKAYEENSQIKMGDVVIASDYYYTTTGIFYGETEKEYWILDPSCQVPQSLDKDWELTKTGKHIDIESLLGQIRSE